MKKALQEAIMAFDKGEIPVGAIIVIDDKILDYRFCIIVNFTRPNSHG